MLLILGCISVEVVPAEETPSRIAFVSNRDGNEEVYAMNADGSAVISVTDNYADDWDPSWRGR